MIKVCLLFKNDQEATVKGRNNAWSPLFKRDRLIEHWFQCGCGEP